MHRKVAEKKIVTRNQYTQEKDTEFVSTSAEKLQDQSDFQVSIDPGFTYTLLSFSLVFTTLEQLIKCKLCDSDINFLKKSERGLGFKLCVKCSCQEQLIDSCPMIKNAYEVNRRFAFVMRLLGVGISGINLFCSLMDLGNGFSNSTYYSVLEQISIAVKAVSSIVFKKAVAEEKQKNLENGNPENELSVSGDGSWSKRGFSSLLGIVSLIGKYSHKILDVIVKSSVCKACQQWAGQEETVEASSWYADHKDECGANHEGSAGKMEVDGVLEMFKRSMEWFGVKYAKYIGDGDSKTFKNLLDEDPYNGTTTIEKKECILHVKKRMYRHLQGAKKMLTQFLKAKKLLEETEKKEAEKKKKGASAPKKRKTKRDSSTSQPKKPKTISLTNKLMEKMSRYYGLAILRHHNSLEEMKKAVWATFYHMTSTDENPQHSYCPEGTNSWCQYQKLKAENMENTFTHPPTFDEDTIKILKPIYEDLSADDLLKRCLGGNTQNDNECFNSCVWNLAPKHIFTGKKTVEIATLIAACTFNEGFMTLLKIMEVMGVTIGREARDFAQVRDEQRISRAEKTTSNASKIERIKQRAAKVEENDAYEEAEGLLYGAGIAD